MLIFLLLINNKNKQLYNGIKIIINNMEKIKL